MALPPLLPSLLIIPHIYKKINNTEGTYEKKISQVPF
jgi:hypothetical protein